MKNTNNKNGKNKNGKFSIAKLNFKTLKGAKSKVIHSALKGMGVWFDHGQPIEFAESN